MNGLPLPASIKRPGVMSTAELATWAPVGRSAVSQIVSHRDIPGLSGNAKNYHVGRGHHPTAHGWAA
jgi:hypothetical protein